jgi:hypothetical protein
MYGNAKIINNNAGLISYGGGVFVQGPSGTFNMSGNAIISGNTADNGFGGGVACTGTFNMTGGTISNNTARGSGGSWGNNGAGSGGGVYVLDGVVTMSGGAINNNEAGEGGGAYIDEVASGGSGTGAINITGGTISNNKATGDGGGIYTFSYDYADTADTTKYANIGISGSASVSGNTSRRTCTPPVNAADFNNSAIRGTLPTFNGQLLNNNNINYYNTRGNNNNNNNNGGSTNPDLTRDIDEQPGILTREHIAYIAGYPDDTVHPGRNITRAEVATVFFRLLKDDVRAENWTKENAFKDVNESDWYNNAISVMSTIGIVGGYPGGTFKPNGAITRAELAAIAARFARLSGMVGENSVEFSDASGHWAQVDIVYAASLGWVNGYPDKTFRPNKPITRAEFITLVNRMLQRVPRTADDVEKEWAKVWSDNSNKVLWYYLAVQEATNSHDYDYHKTAGDDFEDGEGNTFSYVMVENLNFPYEYWTGYRENPDWAALEKSWAQARAVQAFPSHIPG